MLPSYYEFYNPVKIISGENALDNLSDELAQLGANSPVVITDKNAIDAKLVKLLKKVSSNSDIMTRAVFKNVSDEASEEVVLQIAKMFRKKRCDSIIAIGGSAVINTAKGVNILVSEGSDDLFKFAGAKMLKRPLKPLITVPTTSNTESVVSKIAVIANLKNNSTMLFTSRFLLPNAAVLDPRMTLFQSPLSIATTAMESLANAIEGFICEQKNPLSDAYSVAAIETIRKNIITAVKDSNDEHARLAMANATTFAGTSFSSSKGGLISTLGYASTAICRVPYSVVISVLLPFGLEYYMDKTKDYLSSLLLPFGGAQEFLNTPQAEKAQRFFELICELQVALKDLCDLPTTLKELGISGDKLLLIAQTAVNDGEIAISTKEEDIETALNILQRAYE